MKVIIELEFEQESINQQDVENYLTELIDDGSLDWYWYDDKYSQATHKKFQANYVQYRKENDGRK